MHDRDRKGRGPKGKPRSKESVLKQVATRIKRGYKHSEETKRKIGDGNRGKVRPPISEETRAKLSNAQLGHFVSEETRRKISVSKKGKVVISEEQRRQISAALKGRKTGPHSDETRAKMVEAWVRRKERARLNSE